MFDGAARAARTEHERAITVAWNTAALGRMKKMPALSKLLGRPTEAKVAKRARHWTKQSSAWERYLKPKG